MSVVPGEVGTKQAVDLRVHYNPSYRCSEPHLRWSPESTVIRGPAGWLFKSTYKMNIKNGRIIYNYNLRLLQARITTRQDKTIKAQ